MKVLLIELEIDPIAHGEAVFDRRAIDEVPGVDVLEVKADYGHGFGFSEIVSILIIVGTGVTADLVASGIKAGVRGVLRKVRIGSKSYRGDSEGTIRAVEDAMSASDAESSDGDAPSYFDLKKSGVSVPNRGVTR